MALLSSLPRDEAGVELLGEGYPYYTEPGPAEILKMIQHVDETMESAPWQAATSRLSEIRDRTAIDRLIEEYISYFAALS